MAHKDFEDLTADGKHRKGRFFPRNPEKYFGDLNKVIYRSSWELYAFKFCDNNPNVLRWGAEPIAIAYQKPVITPNGMYTRPASYFPDLFVEYKNRKGEIIKELIEIKPAKQRKVSRSRNPKVKLQEDFTLTVNRLKWSAAKAWCDKHGILFRVVDETDLYRMGKL